MELQSFRHPIKRFPSVVIGVVWIVLVLLALPVQAQRKEGHWVDPVSYFKLKGKGYLKEEALYDIMWDTKERFIVGMKCTIYNFTTVGDEYGESKLPLQASPNTFYLYINEPGVIAATSDWTKLPNGNMLGVYKIGATDVTFSFNPKTHHYSFFYYPEGTYDFAGTKDLSPEHRQALDIREMGMFYFDQKGLIGYFENAYMQNDDWEEDAKGRVVDIAHKHEYYLQFSIDEVLLDGTDTPLTETERQSLINTMEDLTDWLLGKGDPLGLGEHTDAAESAVVEVIGAIGAILLSNGAAALSGAAGGAGGAALGGAGEAAGGSPTAPPDMPNMEGTNPKKKEEDETPSEDNEPEPPTPYFDQMTRQNADGTLSVTDPITGKPLTYYPTPDGKWESEMGTIYDKQDLNENLRYRAENAGVLKLDADQAAKNVAEQHAAWEAQNQRDLERGYSDQMKEYRDWKAQQDAELQKQEKLDHLACKYGVPATEKAVKDALKFEQTMAQLDHNMHMSESEAYDGSIDYLEKVDKYAEIGVNVLSGCVPGGGAVKNAYTFAKATLVAGSEAVVQGMDAGEGVAHVLVGMGNGALGVIQNEAGNLTEGANYATLKEWGINVLTEDLKEGMNAVYQGKGIDEIGQTLVNTTGKKTAEFGVGKLINMGFNKLKDTATASLDPEQIQARIEDGKTVFSEKTAKNIDKWLNQKHSTTWGPEVKGVNVNVTDDAINLARGTTKAFSTGEIDTGALIEGGINEFLGQNNAYDWGGDLAEWGNDKIIVGGTANVMYGAGKMVDAATETKNQIAEFAHSIKDFSNTAEKFRKTLDYPNIPN